MKLISDALAQTEQPAAPAPAPAAPTPPAPSVPAPAPAPQATQTGVAANGAQDQNQPPSVPDMLSQLVPIFVIMGIVYIIVIRPRARREREAQEALRNVRRGDVVATVGGLIGKVARAIDDNEVELEIAPNTRIRILRAAITDVRSRGEPVKDAPAAAPAPAPAPSKPAGKSSSQNKAKS
jgi:preprotein translocase subunit YajC